jgi:5-oxoprolinase (ATP-hydrolysing)
MSIEAIAYGFLRVANDTMAKPIAEVSIARGFDLGSHLLASFGGAGGQHACAIAADLGVRDVVIHRHAGILSAYGMSEADILRTERLSIEATLDSALLTKLQEEFARLEAAYPGALFTRSLLMRYEGIDFAILTTADKTGSFAEAFRRAYEERFGFTLDLPIRVDELQLGIRFVTEKIARPTIPQSRGSKKPLEAKMLYTCNGWEEAALYRLQDLEAGDRIEGPAILIDRTSTIIVEPGASAELDRYGDLRITVEEKVAVEKSESLDAVDLAIFANLFISIARQMGAVLQNAALSTNIKERLDFSCALFDAEGSLVANAPHIPVHLGSMSYVVREMLARFEGEIEEGDVFLSNAPFEGGSHLPDLTVITPHLEAGEIRYITASRGHHADIGGITPGSMPPVSRLLAEEGAAIESFVLVRDGVFREEAISGLLQKEQTLSDGRRVSGTRRLSDNLSYLKAQVAANQRGIDLIGDMVDQYGLDVVQAYMGHVRRAAEEAVCDSLRRLGSRKEGTQVLRGEDFLDDGSPIRLTITVDPETGTARFDFSGTGHELGGNLNAPRAVTQSAILYCLRCLVREDIPLNSGCLAPIEMVIPVGTLLDPSPTAAVVGGNVLTSQRVVDVIFKAFGVAAASQGCMNNFTFGNEEFGYYETIGGGAGAGPGWHGQSGVHTHMTNTRITDPEILERRYPVLLREFSLRKNSGGAGRFRGGDGLVREIEFLAPMQAAILSERRVFAPYGLEGGEAGARGENLCMRADGRVLNLGGKNSITLAPGDRIRILTPGGGGFQKPEN